MESSQKRFVALLTAFLAGVPSVALASGDGGHGFVFTEHGFYLIDFIVLVAALVYFVRKPLKKFLQGRRDTMEREIDEAKALQAEARAVLDEYRERLKNVDAEVKGILERAHEEATAAKARIIAEGEAQAKKLVGDAEARIRQEHRTLQARLTGELIELAATRAEELAKRGLDGTKQRAFMQEYIEHVEALSADGAGAKPV